MRRAGDGVLVVRRVKILGVITLSSLVNKRGGGRKGSGETDKQSERREENGKEGSGLWY